MHSPSFRDPSGPASAAEQPLVCPFHNGPETLDILLAELPSTDSALLNLALELRKATTDGTDAENCLRLLFALRSALAGRHHLAFYRVRRWIRRSLVGEVRLDRASAWQPCELPLDCARFDELVNRCLAAAAGDSGVWPTTAVFRLRFAHSVSGPK